MKHLKFEEAEEVLQLLIEYDPKVDNVTVEDDEIQDVEFEDIKEVESPFDIVEEQGSLL